MKIERIREIEAAIRADPARGLESLAVILRDLLNKQGDRMRVDFTNDNLSGESFLKWMLDRINRDADASDLAIISEMERLVRENPGSFFIIAWAKTVVLWARDPFKNHSDILANIFQICKHCA